ncbi:unnamed protein product [Porites evermanni]|uniref:Uncharacterized protein n=1 Tax=Porites evermanni TaxID=104178 RepID=A0ABN8SYF3_9CNID|nr:unnamed protein product [Porites evermanni]
MTTTSEPAPCQQTVHFISEYLSKPPIFPVPVLKMNFLVFSAAFTMFVTIHGDQSYVVRETVFGEEWFGFLLPCDSFRLVPSRGLKSFRVHHNLACVAAAVALET